MKRVICIFVSIVSVMGCKRPYNPPAITGNGSYLVVEGVINSGTDSTIIKLSRTVNVSSKVTANPVTGAAISVESDQNVSFPLSETTNGNYVSPGLNLDNTHTYRLNIKTPDNKQYLSDRVPVKVTPPIDSIGFNIITTPDTGIQIYANSRDPQNKTHYYRWDYSENWQFNAKFVSRYITNGSAIILRTPDQNITTCYTNDISSDIVLGSSAKLQQDVIYQGPIVFIKSTSEKIEDEYSILLHEYALTNNAYNFWINLKKNTEQLGSIFDAQPSQILGNIHCITNPSEPVIGYVSACTVSSKRVFIYSYKLPAWAPGYPYTCQQDSELYCCRSRCRNCVALNLIPLSSVLIPTTALGANPQIPDGFYGTPRECADCTIRGSKVPPPFWR